MKTLWYYISYPIRLMLKEKVELYKSKLAELQWQQKHIVPKARREGATMRVCYHMEQRRLLAYKYERFINNWQL